MIADELFLVSEDTLRAMPSHHRVGRTANKIHAKELVPFENILMAMVDLIRKLFIPHLDISVHVEIVGPHVAW